MDLETLSENLRRLDRIGVEIAEGARPRIEEAARATARAGTDAYGNAWEPKKDGGRPLANAASAISAEVSGVSKAVVTLILRGHHVFHHRGKGRRHRPILPSHAEGLPSSMTDAIREAAGRVVARAMGGG